MWGYRSYLEVTGGYNFFTSKQLMAVGACGAGEVFTHTPSLVFNAVYLFGGERDMYSVYVKKDGVALSNKGRYLLSRDDGSEIEAEEQWDLHYVGIGARKYFFAEQFKTFMLLPYLGADAGAYFAPNAYSELSVYGAGGTETASGKFRGEGFVPGLNFEAGADFWFMEEAAIVLKTGYRICSGMLRATLKEGDLKPAGIADVLEVPVNHSGFYIQAGFTLNFKSYNY